MRIQSHIMSLELNSWHVVAGGGRMGRERRRRKRGGGEEEEGGGEVGGGGWRRRKETDKCLYIDEREKKSPFGHFALCSSSTLCSHKEEKTACLLDSVSSSQFPQDPRDSLLGTRKRQRRTQRGDVNIPGHSGSSRPHQPHFYHSRHHHQSHSPSCSFQSMPASCPLQSLVWDCLQTHLTDRCLPSRPYLNSLIITL